jgi:hypothetical protein
MFYRRSFSGRLILGALLLFLLFGGASRLFRAGYEQGFVQGAALAATDGAAVDGPGLPAFGRGWGRGGLGAAEFGFFGFGLLGFGFVAFVALMMAACFGRRRWGRHPGGHWHHHHPDGPIGPEKQPQEYV